MYLKNLVLRNFRSFDDGVVDLQKDLTVFVGENNGGKSNAIDAIRLITHPLGGRREIYCEATDVRFHGGASSFELEATFAGLDAGQQGRFISAVTDKTLTQAKFGLGFQSGAATERPVLWTGRPGMVPERGCHEMVRHVYLPPLRDAKRALASGNPTRIMALLNHFLEGASSADMARDLARRAEHDVLTKVDEAVGKGLSSLTSGVRRQTAALGFASHESLIDIARDLRFKLADHGVAAEDLRYSGHGYANLLFMATIAVELEKVRTADLTLFLVEEPEAHLHPQLQAAVLAFLCDKAAESRSEAPTTGPAGEVQVIVATHSPNLSAWVSSKQLVVFKSLIAPGDDKQPVEVGDAEDPRKDPEPHLLDATGAVPDERPEGEPSPAARPVTRCIALAKLDIEQLERGKIDRYLDVTKAALLFGGRVLLVEGIAEALLLPVIARLHTLKNEPEKLRLFRSVVFVPIDGVDFLPYVNLLTLAVGNARIAERVVVVTDGDRGTGKGEDDVEDNDESRSPRQSTTTDQRTPGERRKAALDALATKNGASATTATFISTYSLETELLNSGNEPLMRKAYLRLHPRSSKKWESAVALEGDLRASAVQAIFKDARKGDFAQILAEMIVGGAAFVAPAYIDESIRSVVG